MRRFFCRVLLVVFVIQSFNFSVWAELRRCEERMVYALIDSMEKAGEEFVKNLKLNKKKRWGVMFVRQPKEEEFVLFKERKEYPILRDVPVIGWFISYRDVRNADVKIDRIRIEGSKTYHQIFENILINKLVEGKFDVVEISDAKSQLSDISKKLNLDYIVIANPLYTLNKIEVKGDYSQEKLYFVSEVGLNLRVVESSTRKIKFSKRFKGRKMVKLGKRYKILNIVTSAGIVLGLFVSNMSR